MRFSLLILLLFISLPASAQNIAAPSASQQAQKILIQKIEIQGFVLGDKNQFVKLFKPYRNKYLSKAGMDAILQKIQGIYEQEGFQELVAITYAVNKHRLIFTVSLTS